MPIVLFYPHILHLPHPSTGRHVAGMGAGGVRCAGKKGQKTIYIGKSIAQSMSNFRGEATGQNYSMSNFRQWPLHRDFQHGKMVIAP